MAVFDDVSEEKLVLYKHKIKWIKRIPVASKADAEVVSFDMKEPLKAECEHFLKCVDQGMKPKTDGEEGLRVLQVLQASQASLDQNSSNIPITQTVKNVSLRQNKHTTASLGRQKSEEAKYFAHESAYIDEEVKIGNGTKIWHFSHILSNSSIGEDCNIGQNVVIGPDVTIGNNCKIQNNVSIYKGITLEDGVFCGPSMVFTNVYNPRAEIRKMDQLRPTLVKKGATIGANATIICGNTVGRYAFIGAGAVVTKDVPDYSLFMGNPGKTQGWMCACGIKVEFESNKARCHRCGAHYVKDGNSVRAAESVA